jgi:LAS superfamily LD-carboxypeptidase LdcB
MRVVDHKKFKYLPKKANKRSKLFLIVVVIVMASVLVYLVKVSMTPKEQASNTDNTQQSSEVKNPATPTVKTGELKQFTAEEFKKLAQSIKYPNTQAFTEPPEITGNKKADENIRKIAESRGYLLGSIPVSTIQKLNEPRLEGDDLLQPQAAIAWADLKKKAKDAGIPLSLLSAYRNPKYQRDLFVSRLLGNGGNVTAIAAGTGSAAVVKTLTMTAPPGYSRHHSGYTIDLWCEDGSGAFVNSVCFRWMKADNYKVAKQTGWIPSYPDGVSLQGPEPEPWEYIWVGKENLTN